MLVIVLIFLVLMILWTVLDWKTEFDFMMLCFKNIMIVPPITTVSSIIKLAGDIFLVGIAIDLLGLSGFYGASAGLFMSNIMSMVFFMPGKKQKELIKSLSMKGNLC